jgi:hypothetical protein
MYLKCRTPVNCVMQMYMFLVNFYIGALSNDSRRSVIAFLSEGPRVNAKSIKLKVSASVE